METLVSSLYVAFGKDELLFQSLFGLPHVLAITQGVRGVDDVHSVAQEASTESGFCNLWLIGFISYQGLCILSLTFFP
jgi:hypothetical protein